MNTTTAGPYDDVEVADESNGGEAGLVGHIDLDRLELHHDLVDEGVVGGGRICAGVVIAVGHGVVGTVEVLVQEPSTVISSSTSSYN